MPELLIALLLIAVVVLIVVILRGRRSKDAPASARDPFAEVGEPAGDPRALKAGDMVEYLGRRYFVRGSVRLSEGGFTWAEHLLDPDSATDATGAAAEKVW